MLWDWTLQLDCVEIPVFSKNKSRNQDEEEDLDFDGLGGPHAKQLTNHKRVWYSFVPFQYRPVQNVRKSVNCKCTLISMVWEGHTPSCWSSKKKVSLNSGLRLRCFRVQVQGFRLRGFRGSGLASHCPHAIPTVLGVWVRVQVHGRVQGLGFRVR
jgi:hypothetical protein